MESVEDSTVSDKAASRSSDADAEKVTSATGSRARLRETKEIYHPPPASRNQQWSKEEWQEWMETSSTHFQKCQNVAMEIFAEYPETLIDLLQATFAAPAPND